jgi:UDP-glucose 4-epimerase
MENEAEVKRKVLVTGASGFIGAAVVAGLAKQGWQVRAAARDPAAIVAPSGVERVVMPDLAAPTDWAPLLAGVNYLVHLAGIAHAHGVVSDSLYTRVNAEAVGELAECARGRLDRFVLVSSARAQAGFSSAQVITESLTPSPIDAYGRSKLLAELLLKKSGVSFTVLRPTLTYGSGVKGNVARLAQLAKLPIPIPFGGLANYRSLLARENLVEAILLVLISERAEGEIFLVSDAEPISVAGMIVAMREGLGRSPGLVSVPSKVLNQLMHWLGKDAQWERLSGSLVVDPSKIQGLGWAPKVITREGLAEMMRNRQTEVVPVI